MRRAAKALVLLFVAGSAAAAQDVVRLNSGRHISGKITLDPTDKQGFRLSRWDTGGVVYIRWSQIPAAEKNRLLNITPDTGPVGLMLDGVRALTGNREVIGILVKEDGTKLLIKTSESRTPKPVPKSALLQPYEKLKVAETAVYSPEEMIENRVAKADESRYEDMLKLGRFAASLALYERAKEFYEKAQAAGDARKDEIEAILVANETLIKEGKAAAVVAEVRALAEDTRYDEAVELAKKLLSEHAETQVAKNNADIVSRLEAEKKDFEQRKGEFLAKKVPEMYKLKRSGLFSQYSHRRNTLSEARSKVGKIDEEVRNYLAEKLKAKPEEIETAWAGREEKIRTATYGEGSWVVKGGQDGGLDTNEKTKPRQQQQNRNFNNPFNRNRNRNRQQQQKPKPLGNKLQTSEEWWKSASSSERKRFLESEYARTSSAVTKVAEEEKKCRHCNGEGVLKANRLGYQVEVKCPRCHDAKVDLIIKYW